MFITVRGQVPRLDTKTWLPRFLEKFVDLMRHVSVFSRKRHRKKELIAANVKLE